MLEFNRRDIKAMIMGPKPPKGPEGKNVLWMDTHSAVPLLRVWLNERWTAVENTDSETIHIDFEGVKADVRELQSYFRPNRSIVVTNVDCRGGLLKLGDTEFLESQLITFLGFDDRITALEQGGAGGYTAGDNITIEDGVISAIDTTYSNATEETSGLMSYQDKIKLNGLNNYVLPTASANDLGGVKVGTNLSIDANGVLSATDTTYSASDNIDITNNVIKAVGYRYNTSNGAFAEGDTSIASGISSHAEGANTTASGQASHAEGAKYESNRNTESLGQASHAEGASTYAKADGSHAEGVLTTAGRLLTEVAAAAQQLGITGTQVELVTKLAGYGAHVEGTNNNALGSGSHAEGNATNALANATHAEGDTTTAFGEASHAEGYNTQAKGNQSHTEGHSTIANGNSSHAEGMGSTATGSYSHAEGSHTESEGRNSHAEGAYSKASGIASHVEGDHTKTNNSAEHSEGSFNKSHTDGTSDGFGTNSTKTLHSIGIGTSDNARKNAVEVMQNADVYIKGVGGYDGVHIKSEQGYETVKTLQQVISGKQDTLIAGQNIVITNNTISAVIDAGFHVEVVQTLPTTGEVNTIYFVPKAGGANPDVYDEYMYINNAWEKIGSTEVDLSNYYNKTEVDTLLSGKQATLTAGNNITINGTTISANDTTYSAGQNIVITNNTIKAVGYTYNRTTGAFTEGDRDIDDDGVPRLKPSATGVMAHAEGCKTKAIGRSSHAEGNGGSATGTQSHAEGSEGNAIGVNSHVEGRQAVANGYSSHAEGIITETGGDYASATSNPKTADSRTDAGAYAHAEGNASIAYGNGSHAEGRKTFAKGSQSHAEGSNTNAIGIASHSEGSVTNALAVASHAEGYNSEVGGNYTSNTKTAGTETGAGAYAHAEGNTTIANGVAAHSEGRLSLAKGNNSHAEGNSTISSGINAHAEGAFTVANGNNTHAEGRFTQTRQNAEHAQGSCNVSHTDDTEDGFGTNSKRTIHSIGIGNYDDSRKNAVEVMQNGDTYLFGVGGYDGVHIPSEIGYSYIKSLQNVIYDLQFRVLMLEPCLPTMLKYKATSNLSEQIAQYIPNYSYGEYRSPEGYAFFNSDLTEIPANSFTDVTDLLKIEIPEGVTDIWSEAFKHCTSLQEVILPRSLSTIDNEVFVDCSSLYTIRYNGTIEDWNNITIGSDVFTGTNVTQVMCIDGPVNV